MNVKFVRGASTSALLGVASSVVSVHAAQAVPVVETAIPEVLPNGDTFDTFDLVVSGANLYFSSWSADGQTIWNLSGNNTLTPVTSVSASSYLSLLGDVGGRLLYATYDSPKVTYFSTAGTPATTLNLRTADQSSDLIEGAIGSAAALSSNNRRTLNAMSMTSGALTPLFTTPVPPPVANVVYTQYLFLGALPVGSRTLVMAQAYQVGTGPYTERYDHTLISTDGTPGGTTVLANYADSQYAYLSSQTTGAGVSYFVNNASATPLMRTDGTPSGTGTVPITVPTGRSLGLQGVTKQAGDVYYNFYNGPVDTAPFYVYHPATQTSTDLSAAVATGRIEYVIPADHLAYLSVYDTLHGNQLWCTDGTALGTRRVTPLDSSVSVNYSLAVGDDLYYYAAYYSEAGGSGTGLFVSDGTPLGTTLIKDVGLQAGSSGGSLYYSNGYVYFVAYSDSPNGGLVLNRVAVPEPTMLSLFGVAGVVALRRHRKRPTNAVALSPRQRRVARAIVDAGVRHLVIGGAAVRHHGVTARQAVDVDVWIDPSPDNRQRFAAALRGLGIRPTDGQLDRLKLMNEQGGVSVLDIAVGLDEPFAPRTAGCFVADVDGVPLTMIGREQLLRHKTELGREKDRADVASVAALPVC